MSNNIIKPLSTSSPPYINLLKSCTSALQLKKVHAQLITNGLSRFSFVSSTLFAHYALSNFTYAQKLFTQIHKPTIFDYNNMIMGHSKTSNLEMGVSVYAQMRSLGISPNARTFPLLAKACENVHSLGQIYGQAVKFGLCGDVYVVSSFIHMYALIGEVGLAVRVFDGSLDRNVVCYTSLISGFCRNGYVDCAREVFDGMTERNDVCCSAMVSGYISNEKYSEGIGLFCELRECGNVRFNKSILMSVLSACAAVGTYEEGVRVHCYVRENYCEYELELGTALIDFYAKCGNVEVAVAIFKKMSCRDVTTWTSMILGLALNGKNDMALDLFREMERIGPKPNAVTFIGILSACNQKTPLTDAWRLFGRMCKVYGIAPLIEHYGCMVDLLARAGQIKKAEILIKSMPMEPDGVIWGSFLNGCLIHGNTELGLNAGKHVIELEPQHSGRYVLLANMYATLGNWESVTRLRKMMKVKQVVSKPGWSSIEIDGITNRFTVDDKSHSHAKDIYQLLSLLTRDLVSSNLESVDPD
ncbi:hypothetical protein DCAR_0626325 [Daucus carota subsp. sativus]|uniref:Pentacotripeptide-repeat region of PRORP domain-containing protein n=1 Tax=Daucus carota subsp. sativus TaxID=79200 RepID=A0AAF0XEQ8_DAUCS|nr:hypothetical protein DCAR_0626325 [Daucus carota subsp. sativus]